MEVWTINHLNSQGNPCDWCPECVGREDTTKALLLKKLAQDYQEWEKKALQEKASLAQETENKQKQKERALLPIQQELEVQQRGRERELRRIRRVFQQQEREAETSCKETLEVAHYRRDQTLQAAQRQLREDTAEVQQQYREDIEEIQQRLTRTQEEHKRSFEAFQLAAEAEQDVLDKKVGQTYWSFNQVRKSLQESCPHPSSEPLQVTLALWPQLDG